MNYKRTKEQILASGYIKKSELQRFYSRPNGEKVYKAAQKIDAEELGEDRVITNMVRIKSVLKVLGIKKGGLTSEI